MNGNGVAMQEVPKRAARTTGLVVQVEQPAGQLAASAWLSARGLRVRPKDPWEVAIALDVVDRPASPTVTSASDTRFHIAIAAGEWGYLFCHRGKLSWIRITDVPHVNERDEFELLRQTPPLRDLGTLVRTLEDKHHVSFRRKHASVRTSLDDAERAIRSWIGAI